MPAVVALVVIVLVALPFFSLRLGSSDQGNDPTGTTTREAYDLLAKGFGPGFNGPLLLVTENAGPADQQALDQLAAEVQDPAGRGQGHRSPASCPTKDGKTVSPDHRLPDDVAGGVADHRPHRPPAPGRPSRPRWPAPGSPSTWAATRPSSSTSPACSRSKLPLFIGLVVVLSFLLLAMVFRSLVIPLTAAVMNLLSIGAAFGILVAVFQWGWLGSVFQVGRPGPIEAFLPVMLFAILFGLSMDYEVFLVSRIHEEWLKSGDNSTAVRNGLAATGKTITAAALIMILVFGSFILGGERVIKEFGLGLAGGILMDAVLIRMAIVPALMFLIGKANWWFPGWLDRILPARLGRPRAASPRTRREPGGPGPAPVEPEPVPV